MKRTAMPRDVLAVLSLVACGGTVEPLPPCATDAGTVTDAPTDTVIDSVSDAPTTCVLLCDPLVGWTCGGRILGCADGGQCCDLQRPTCGCFAGLGYLCGGALLDDATSCAKCGERCTSSTDAGAE